MKTENTMRYNIINDKIELTDKRKKPILIKDFIKKLNIEDSSKIINNSTFEFDNLCYKFIQITNDTKHVLNREINIIDKKNMIAKWDLFKGDLSNVDFIILIYSIEKKYLNFIISKDNFIKTKNREINFFISLEELLNANSKKEISNFVFYRERANLKKENFIFFNSEDFLKLKGK